MVRIKHRYLLFNILYPSASPPITSSSAESLESPPPYILFSRPSPSHLNASILSALLRAEIHSLFGDHGLSVTQSSLRIVYFSPITSTGILRVPRAHFRMVWAALTFITSISGEKERGGRWRGAPRKGNVKEQETPCVIRVARVSGTIRKSEEELLSRARREVVRAKMEGRSTGEEEEVLGMFAEKGKQRRAISRFTDEEEESIIDLDDDEEEDIGMSD